MKKKYLALILGIVMVLSFGVVRCGKKTTENTEKNINVLMAESPNLDNTAFIDDELNFYKFNDENEVTKYSWDENLSGTEEAGAKSYKIKKDGMNVSWDNFSGIYDKDKKVIRNTNGDLTLYESEISDLEHMVDDLKSDKQVKKAIAAFIKNNYEEEKEYTFDGYNDGYEDETTAKVYFHNITDDGFKIEYTYTGEYGETDSNNLELKYNDFSYSGKEYFYINLENKKLFKVLRLRNKGITFHVGGNDARYLQESVK